MSFYNKREQYKHMEETHQGDKEFLCHLCDKRYFMERDLNRHLRVKHEGPEEGPPPPCHICQKTFTKASLLRAHVRSHDDTTWKVCNLCGQKMR